MTTELTPREAYEAGMVATSLTATGTALADYSTVQSVDTLANYSYWTPAFANGYPTITYSFPVVTGAADEPADYATNSRSGTLRTFSAAQAETARLAVSLWDDLIPLTFVESLADPNADMRFFNSTLINTAGGAPAGLGTDGDVWIYNYDANPPSSRDWTVGDFYFGYWFLHEIGHTLGLSHAGGYPGPGYNGLNYLQDNAVYTLMSYNSDASAGVLWTADMATPMVNDVAAIQYYYGADMTTRTGDTVYGFNSNVLDRLSLNFDAMLAQEGKIAPITIWDAGGNDTLDLSKFSADAAIDLAEGGYSNAGGQEMAIGIAYGAIIENAEGGRGSDVIFGNASANVLTGNAGDDRLYGGAETAGVVADPRDFLGIEINRDGTVRNQYLSASSMTGLSGAAFTFEAMLKITGVPSGTIAIASYNVSGNDNQFLVEASGTLKVTIANKAAYDTGVSVASLLDEEPHRLSVTWDKATGTIALYIDGSLAHTGTYSAATGATVRPLGTLVLGQEQDSPGGGFDINQIFQGVIGDVRIFDDVRSAAEISASAFTPLQGTEQGLVHNWQAAAGDTTSVTDFASIPNNLAVMNGALPVDTAPTAPATDDDSLIGGDGNDTLYGGAGDDTLTGGGGSSSPFAPTFAVGLNPPGTTSQYAAVANYSGISGASGAVKFTIEMLVQVSHQPGSEVDFFSYANGQTSNALLLNATNNGTIHLNYRGTDNDTGLSSALLTDGNEHRLSLAWDGSASGGGYTLYIDGAAVYSAVHTNQASSLTGSGTLVFGQEQDSIGGGFSPGQIFPGSIADIRIFNTVRSASEIASNAFGPLADPASTPGLIANWQAIPGNSAAMTDAVGGTALTLTGSPATKGFGGWDDDALYGGLGNDTLTGGAGNDTLSGGDGFDTAAYAGKRADYAIVRNGDGTVTVSGTGDAAGDAADTLDSIERIAFSDVTLTMADALNHAPTAIALANTVKLAEGAASSTPTKVADIVVTDDVAGTDTLNLTGTDAALFEIVGSELFLKSGVGLNYESRTSYYVDIEVEDPLGQGAAGPLSASFTLEVLNVSPEIVLGTAGRDLLIGGSDADWIFGLKGRDALVGLGGNDRLTGGLGRDIAVGGKGADVFDFNARAESTAKASGRDIIRDFEHRSDHIDLSTIDAKSGAGNQAFKWIGKSAFHHVKGELHYVLKGSAAIVEADINGDGRADFSIKLDHVSLLSKGDFIL